MSQGPLRAPRLAPRQSMTERSLCLLDGWPDDAVLLIDVIRDQEGRAPPPARTLLKDADPRPALGDFPLDKFAGVWWATTCMDILNAFSGGASTVEWVRDRDHRTMRVAVPVPSGAHQAIKQLVRSARNPPLLPPEVRLLTLWDLDALTVVDHLGAVAYQYRSRLEQMKALLDKGREA